MKRKHIHSTLWKNLRPSLLLLGVGSVLAAIPPGPEPQIPAEGQPPGPFPNTTVTAVNVNARGGSEFNSNVEVAGFEGQGPVAWSVNRYNRGDIALRLAPNDPEAALSNLGQGFIEFADDSPSLPANQAWRPDPRLGVVIPTARVNGPVDWGDGEGAFFPTIAISGSSSGPGYDMVTGEFANGDLDINLGRAGTHASSPEGNFPFSAAWFPYDQGWIGGSAAGPDFEGRSSWTEPGAASAAISPGIVRWPDFPAGSLFYGGLAEVNLPGVNSLTDGMLFTVSADGSSDVNITGVAPKDDGRGWRVAIREDFTLTGETLVDASQSEFEFVYVPYDAGGLIGGYIDGTTGEAIESRGDFTLARTAAGTYSLSIPGEDATSGTLVLQAADWEPDTFEPVPTRAFMSFEPDGEGNFIIQSRVTETDMTTQLRDTDFYFAWIDFEEPLTAPDGPRFRSLPPVALTDEFTIADEAGLGVNTHEPEVMVTTIDPSNWNGFTDPITGQFALGALIGYFVNPETLETTRDPFLILGNPLGAITRHAVVYNEFSKQYIVVANARGYGSQGADVPLIAIVNPNSAAGGDSPVVEAFAFDADSAESYDDVAVAASSQNGNFILVAEHDFADQGEGTVGVLFDSEGNRLTDGLARLDTMQPAGDEDDPEIKYFEGLDAFFYTSNTDWDEGVQNRVSGAVVQTTPGGDGALQVGEEQLLTAGEFPGETEGHAASIQSPFNGEVLTAFDLGGNNVARGAIAYTEVGPAPVYEFSHPREPILYLDGTDADPFQHNHPQIAADPNSGVFALGYKVSGSSAGYPNAYVVHLLGPDGLPLPSQLGLPYFIADTPGGVSQSANFHNIKYSPVSDSFLVVFNTEPGVTYVTALEVNSNHLEEEVDAPSLEIAKSGEDVVLRWEASAAGFILESTASLTDPQWTAVSTQPTQNGGMNEVAVDPADPARFYRLARQ